MIGSAASAAANTPPLPHSRAEPQGPPTMADRIEASLDAAPPVLRGDREAIALALYSCLDPDSGVLTLDNVDPGLVAQLPRATWEAIAPCCVSLPPMDAAGLQDVFGILGSLASVRRTAFHAPDGFTVEFDRGVPESITLDAMTAQPSSMLFVRGNVEMAITSAASLVVIELPAQSGSAGALNPALRWDESVRRPPVPRSAAAQSSAAKDPHEVKHASDAAARQNDPNLRAVAFNMYLARCLATGHDLQSGGTGEAGAGPPVTATEFLDWVQRIALEPYLPAQDSRRMWNALQTQPSMLGPVLDAVEWLFDQEGGLTAHGEVMAWSATLLLLSNLPHAAMAGLTGLDRSHVLLLAMASEWAMGCMGLHVGTVADVTLPEGLTHEQKTKEFGARMSRAGDAFSRKPQGDIQLKRMLMTVGLVQLNVLRQEAFATSAAGSRADNFGKPIGPLLDANAPAGDFRQPEVTLFSDTGTPQLDWRDPQDPPEPAPEHPQQEGPDSIRTTPARKGRRRKAAAAARRNTMQQQTGVAQQGARVPGESEHHHPAHKHLKGSVSGARKEKREAVRKGLAGRFTVWNKEARDKVLAAMEASRQERIARNRKEYGF